MFLSAIRHLVDWCILYSIGPSCCGLGFGHWSRIAIVLLLEKLQLHLNLSLLRRRSGENKLPNQASIIFLTLYFLANCKISCTCCPRCSRLFESYLHIQLSSEVYGHLIHLSHSPFTRVCNILLLQNLVYIAVFSQKNEWRWIPELN